MSAALLGRGPGPVVSPPPLSVAHIPNMSPVRRAVRSGTDVSVSQSQIEDLRRAHKQETERAVRSATEELSVYSAIVEERKRKLGESNESGVMALLAAQNDSKMSALALQHTQELDRVKRAADDAARELQLTIRTMQQQHETAASVIEARHKQDLHHVAAKTEDHLQQKMAMQHEAHAINMASLSEKHNRALQEMEMQWSRKVESLQLEHSAQLSRERTDSQRMLQQMEGNYDNEVRQLQKQEQRERAAELHLASEKVHNVESKNLQLQMQVVDLNSKLDVAQAQMQASAEQAKQSREGMEHNLQSLMRTIEEERAARQDTDVRLQQALQDANARATSDTQKHRTEMDAAATLHAQQVASLQGELQKLADAEKDRVATATQQSRQLEKDVADFKERLQNQLSEQLHTINMQHAQEIKDLQTELLQAAREQNEQNVMAVDSAYIEKISKLERGKQEQLQSLEETYGERNRALETECQRLKQQVKAQKELAEMEQKTQHSLLVQKHEAALKELERDLTGKMQDLALETDGLLRKQEREAALTLEREKLAVATQCREFASQLEERDRQQHDKLQNEIDILRREKGEYELRLHHDLDNAQRQQDQQRGDFQKHLEVQGQAHVEQMRAVELENARLRSEVEERLNAASEKYNRQLCGMDSENRRIFEAAEARVQELADRHKQEVAAAGSDYKSALEESRREVENLKHQLEVSQSREAGLTSTTQRLEAEMSQMHDASDSRAVHDKEQQSKVDLLEEEKRKLIAEREEAIGALNDKMQNQLKAAEEERLTMMQQLDKEREHSQKLSQSASAADTTHLVRNLEHQLHDTQVAMCAKEAEQQHLVHVLQDQLVIADAEIARLSQEMAKAPLPNLALLTPPDPLLAAVEAEKADTLAAQRLLEAEQLHQQEKARMQEQYMQQLAEAERLAQQQLGNVGEKFGEQMGSLQQVVSSLQQRLMEKDGQTKRVEMELRRAQKAITEITVIYQAREREFVSEAHRMQMAQLGLNDGIKQLQLEKELQMSQDEQKLMVLQNQVQQALSTMQQVVTSNAGGEVPISRALSSKALSPARQQRAEPPLVKSPPLLSQVSTSTQQLRGASALRSGSLAAFNSTPAVGQGQGQAAPLNNIFAQHAFSQQLAKQNAAAVKLQERQRPLTLGNLQQQHSLLAPMNRKLSLTSDQLAAL